MSTLSADIPNSSNSRKLGIAIAGAILYLVLTCGAAVLFFMHHTSYDMDGTNLRKFSGATSRTANRVVQIYVPLHDNLQSVSFAVVNRTQPNIVAATLIDEQTGRKLTSAEIHVPIDQSPQYAVLQYSPLGGVANQKVILTIDLSTAQGLQLLTVPHDRYPNGKLIIDGTSLPEENLVVNARYRTTHPVAVVLNRLSLIMPFPFNYPVTYVVLFFLFIGVSGWVVFIFFHHLLD